MLCKLKQHRSPCSRFSLSLTDHQMYYKQLDYLKLATLGKLFLYTECLS